MTLNHFRVAIRNYAEARMLKYRFKQRQETYQEIYWKLTKSPSYGDMLNYFDQ